MRRATFHPFHRVSRQASASGQIKVPRRKSTRQIPQLEMTRHMEDENVVGRSGRREDDSLGVEKKVLRAFPGSKRRTVREGESKTDDTRRNDVQCEAMQCNGI
jgi:hypothetical protein